MNEEPLHKLDSLTNKDKHNSTDDYAGLGEARDAEQIEFSKQLLEQIKKEKGVAKISTWVYKNKQQWYVQKLEEREEGVKVWSGPNPPMGYHTSQRTYQIIDYSFIPE